MTLPSILWPTELGERSRLALQCAVAIAGDRWRRLTALIVVDPLLAQAAAVAYDTRLTDARLVDLRAFLVQTLADTLIVVEQPNARVAVGRPTREILRAARRKRPDLIVLGTHGRTGFAKLLTGSVAQRVLRAAPAPPCSPCRPRTCRSPAATLVTGWRASGRYSSCSIHSRTRPEC